jgi:hypothetical protein
MFRSLFLFERSATADRFGESLYINNNLSIGFVTLTPGFIPGIINPNPPLTQHNRFIGLPLTKPEGLILL